MELCPACKSSAKKYPSAGDFVELDCPKCGHYRLSGTAKAVLPTLLSQNEDCGPLLSHYIRKRVSTTEKIPLITAQWVENILKNKSLPTPLEQADNIILWLGDNLGSRLEKSLLPINFEQVASIVGAYDQYGVGYLLDSMAEQGWIPRREGHTVISLTFEGWQKL